MIHHWLKLSKFNNIKTTIILFLFCILYSFSGYAQKSDFSLQYVEHEVIVSLKMEKLSLVPYNEVVDIVNTDFFTNLSEESQSNLIALVGENANLSRATKKLLPLDTLSLSRNGTLVNISDTHSIFVLSDILSNLHDDSCQS
ncbi:MAG: hypothetical protein ACI8ZO_001226 [Flavobacteriales bacterium]|jgi:hypothetical protein